MVKAGRLDPVRFDRGRTQHHGNVRVDLAQSLDQPAGAVRFTRGEGVIDQDVGLFGEIAGTASQDRAAHTRRADALLNVVAAPSQRVGLLVGDIDVVMDEQYLGHRVTTVPGRSGCRTSTGSRGRT